MRRLLATQVVSATTGPTNLSTADNFYSQTLGPGFVLLSPKTISVPAFDTTGGKVLTGVKIDYRVDLIQEFLAYNFTGPNPNNFTVNQGITFRNFDTNNSVTLAGTANASATLSVTEAGLTAADIPSLSVSTALAVDSDPGTPGNQAFVVGPDPVAGDPPSVGTFIGGDSDSNPDPDLVAFPVPNEASKLFSSLTLTTPAQLAAFISGIGDTTVDFSIGTSGSINLAIGGGSVNFQQDGALATVERGEITITYFFGIPQARISIGPSDVNAVGDSHTFTALVEKDDGLAIGQPGGDAFNGFAPASALVDFSLDGTNGAIPDVSAPVNLAPADPSNVNDLATNAAGNASVTFSSATAGLVAGSASADLTVLGVPLTVTTNGLNGNSNPAIKRFVDARIEINPDGTNPVNAPHTFTISVFQNDGLSAAQGGDGVSGFTAVGAGVPVTMTLTNGGGAVANPAGPFVNVTNASGQFGVTFTSATAGTVTGHGITDVSFARLPSEQPPPGAIVVHRETNGAQTVLGSGVFNSDDAIKTFVVQPPPGGEGLTPGFWKNHTALWVGLSPNQTVASVFGPITNLYGIGNKTLLQALSFSSGTLGSGQLIRHAVAGILNANHPLVDYPFTKAQIVAGVQAALNTFNQTVIQTVKDLLEDANELGGGIDAHGNPI